VLSIIEHGKRIIEKLRRKQNEETPLTLELLISSTGTDLAKQEDEGSRRTKLSKVKDWWDNAQFKPIGKFGVIGAVLGFIAGSFNARELLIIWAYTFFTFLGVGFVLAVSLGLTAHTKVGDYIYDHYKKHIDQVIAMLLIGLYYSAMAVGYAFTVNTIAFILPYLSNYEIGGFSGMLIGKVMDKFKNNRQIPSESQNQLLENVDSRRINDTESGSEVISPEEIRSDHASSPLMDLHQFGPLASPLEIIRSVIRLIKLFIGSSEKPSPSTQLAAVNSLEFLFDDYYGTVMHQLSGLTRWGSPLYLEQAKAAYTVLSELSEAMDALVQSERKHALQLWAEAGMHPDAAQARARLERITSRYEILRQYLPFNVLFRLSFYIKNKTDIDDLFKENLGILIFPLLDYFTIFEYEDLTEEANKAALRMLDVVIREDEITGRQLGSIHPGTWGIARERLKQRIFQVNFRIRQTGAVSLRSIGNYRDEIVIMLRGYREALNEFIYAVTRGDIAFALDAIKEANDSVQMEFEKQMSAPKRSGRSSSPAKLSDNSKDQFQSLWSRMAGRLGRIRGAPLSVGAAAVLSCTSCTTTTSILNSPSVISVSTRKVFELKPYLERPIFVDYNPDIENGVVGNATYPAALGSIDTGLTGRYEPAIDSIAQTSLTYEGIRMLGIPVHVADNPLISVVRGTGIVLEDIEVFRDVLIENEDELPPK